MTRWFHGAAAALLILAVFAGFGRGPGQPVPEPRAQLIGLLAKSGLAFEGEQPLFEGGSALSFKQAACPTDFKLIYLPSLSRIAPAQLAQASGLGAKPVFVHDGDVIGGLGSLDLIPRWLWRKLLVAVRLRPSERWQSTALALFVPRNCAPPPIDWRSLTQQPAAA